MPRPTPLAGDPKVAEELNELTLSALARVGDGSCGHIITIASLCVACPADGLRCPACAERHFDRDHTLEWRHTCDRCGNVDQDSYPAVGWILAPARDRVVTVALDGVGLCPPCARLGTVGQAGGVG